MCAGVRVEYFVCKNMSVCALLQQGHAHCALTSNVRLLLFFIFRCPPQQLLHNQQALLFVLLLLLLLFSGQGLAHRRLQGMARPPSSDQHTNK